MSVQSIGHNNQRCKQPRRQAGSTVWRDRSATGGACVLTCDGDMSHARGQHGTHAVGSYPCEVPKMKRAPRVEVAGALGEGTCCLMSSFCSGR